MSEPLRTLEFGELLDSGFSLYRHNFTVFFATVLIPQLPLVLLWLALPVVAGAVGRDTVITLTSLLVMPYSLFATLLAYSALTYAVGMAYSGDAPALADSLGTGLRNGSPAITSSTAPRIIAVSLQAAARPAGTRENASQVRPARSLGQRARAYRLRGVGRRCSVLPRRQDLR
jgi:hypothetical protein